MTIVDEQTSPSPVADDGLGDIMCGSLTRSRHLAIIVAAVLVGAASWIPSGSVNLARWVVVSLLVYTVTVYVVSRRVESRRHATDRLATTAITTAFVLVMLPLVSVIWTVVERGSNRFDWTFYSETMRGVVGEGGGAYHAIVGTLIITALASLFSIPIGVFTAIYLVEYGGDRRFARSIRSLVDVMTGIPSIVAGLFAFALFSLVFGPGHRSGLAGAVALTLLMTPVVVRASEEMLRLVPQELREAAYALGVPKWKTIAKVVLPTAIAGIITGAVLAIARVIGETAPLLITVGLAQGVNWNPFEGRMTTLPVYTYYQYVQPGLPPEAGQDRAWAAALTLVVIVAALFSLARVLSTLLTPKGLR